MDVTSLVSSPFTSFDLLFSLPEAGRWRGRQREAVYESPRGRCVIPQVELNILIEQTHGS